MEVYRIENLSFAYPNRESDNLKGINLAVRQGEFVIICGKSGCGKTTLLRLLKTALSPFGSIDGQIYFNGTELSRIGDRTQATDIGFVMQNPDNQIATDKVWHELAFGLESLGCSTAEIRTRVSEMASFFGIQNWFHKKTAELSGGQKQLLNLASVMVMQPEVLILDEPTSQLDPIASGEFLQTLQKINQELGTTIILAEHRLEEAFAMADRVVVMDDGKIIANDTPRNVGQLLKKTKHHMYNALPVPVRIYGGVESDLECPITIREGKNWLTQMAKSHILNEAVIPKDKKIPVSNPVIEVRDVHFRYDRESDDVVKGLSLTVDKGELYTILGGNGTGKTTAISLISGLIIPKRGEILIQGQKLSEIKNLYSGILGVLPQNPQSLFAKKTVYLDLWDMSDKKLSKHRRQQKVAETACLCRIEKLLESHPYDLSGGEQQRVALAMVLLKEPEILILDEPTKGMDAHFKRIFAEILEDLKKKGVTILMVSHDIEFCAEFADKCAMFFDGNITAVETPRTFFCGNRFYTTSANRIAGKLLPNAILAEDIIRALDGTVEYTRDKRQPAAEILPKTERQEGSSARLNPKRIALGGFFAVIMAVTYITYGGSASYAFAAVLLIELALCLACFFPQQELGIAMARPPKGDRRLGKRTLAAAFVILVAIPLTIYFGIHYLGDRKYYFISLLIIFETVLPFCMIFENRKPQAREIVVISVLCALAVAGRTAFFMLPEFKPVVALVIIAGVCFGGETGFLVGAVTGFVSNFFFGQGPWTPWQMFAFGIIGFLAGIFFRKGIMRRTRPTLCIFGFLTTLIIYGGIMNTATVIMSSNIITKEMLISAYVVGFPIDLIHALSTGIFLWFLSNPMIEKLERIKIKYGLVRTVSDRYASEG